VLGVGQDGRKPEHAQILRNIADAWLKLADELEQPIPRALKGSVKNASVEVTSMVSSQG
jgi:hypothetical protein